MTNYPNLLILLEISNSERIFFAICEKNVDSKCWLSDSSSAVGDLISLM